MIFIVRILSKLFGTSCNFFFTFYTCVLIVFISFTYKNVTYFFGLNFEEQIIDSGRADLRELMIESV